ncbi:MAG: hypothetical protein ABIV47_03015 [Roseiflexaceae bacterium]
MDSAQFHQFTATLQHTLSADARVRALIGIGSLAQPERVDRWSDHDFWVITTVEGQEHFLTDLSWLPDHSAIALALRPAPEYYTILYTTGHVAEFAVFALTDLSRGQLDRYRMLFDKSAIEPQIQAIYKLTQAKQHADSSHIIGHFLVTLCTGAARDARGERLSAHTYIFQYALDDLLMLITQHIPALQLDLQDRFDPRRRFEQAYPDLSTLLKPMLTLAPAAAALLLLELAQDLFQDHMPAFPAPAVTATCAYLQMINQRG